jgi:ABC-type antimicrobial peptide transport system, ATPase component
MLLEAKNLKKEYQRGKQSFFAVNDVSLSIGEKDFILITGRSGSGKSTLLNMLAGLLPPTGGEVTFNGRNYSGLTDDGLSLLRNEEIGFIPQGQSLLPNLSALDNVLLPFRFYRAGKGPVDKACELLEQMDVLHLKNAYPEELSGGELRRITIARSLINAPSLLLADEPTGDLDPETGDGVMGLFTDISQNGVAVVLVSHELEAARYGSRHLVMNSGRLGVV